MITGEKIQYLHTYVCIYFYIHTHVHTRIGLKQTEDSQQISVWKLQKKSSPKNCQEKESTKSMWPLWMNRKKYIMRESAKATYRRALSCKLHKFAVEECVILSHYQRLDTNPIMHQYSFKLTATVMAVAWPYWKLNENQKNCRK